MSIRNKKAFTLIELLVVVVIIGILAAVALPKYQFAVERARAVEALQIAKTLSNSMELQYMMDGHYPTMDNLLIGLAGNPGDKLSNYFQFSLSGNYLYIFRKPSSAYPYIFIYVGTRPEVVGKDFERKIICKETQYNKYPGICKSLGGRQSNYYFNEDKPWIVY